MKKGLPAFLTGFTIFEDFFFDFSSFISESISSILHKTPPLRGQPLCNETPSRRCCRLPQKQYVLKVDKSLNFKNVKHEKESIHRNTNCSHSQRV
jgi:hypothetical protein